MSDPLKFKKGEEINGERVAYLMEHAVERGFKEFKMRGERVGEFGEYQKAVSFIDGIGDKQAAFLIQARAFSDGIRHSLYLDLFGATCGSDAACTDGIQKNETNLEPAQRKQIPGKDNWPKAVWRGDFNGDGLTDLMVVLKNGHALVFEQRP